MEANFTKGPWKANCFMVVAPGERHHGPYGGLEVCHTGLVGRNKPPQQAEADARLIAAAPDLLDVCQAVKDKLDYLCNLWGAEGVTRSLIQKLEFALAKATGEQVAS